jgi:hypothetical protein
MSFPSQNPLTGPNESTQPGQPLTSFFIPLNITAAQRNRKKNHQVKKTW